MNLSFKEHLLIGRVFPGWTRMRMEPLYEYYQQIVEKRDDLTMRRFEIVYPRSRRVHNFIEITSNNLRERDGVLNDRVGEHGEEHFAVVAKALSFEAVVEYAHQRNIGMWSQIAVNENGLMNFMRYNEEYYLDETGLEIKYVGTNDGVRYYSPLEKRWIDTLNGSGLDGEELAWKWSDMEAILPVDARFSIDRLRTQIEYGNIDFRKPVSHVSFHEDHVEKETHDEKPQDGLPVNGTYYGAYKQSDRYRLIVSEVEKTVPIIRNVDIDTGDGGRGWLDENGQVTVYDGTYGNLFHLLGARDAVTVEFREDTDAEQMKDAIEIWEKGLIDLMIQ